MELSDRQGLYLPLDRLASITVQKGPVEYQQLRFEFEPMPPLPARLDQIDTDAFETCFARLRRAFETWGGRSEQAGTWLRALIDALDEDHRDKQTPWGVEDYLRRCCREIDAEPGRKWSVSELARRAGWSADHFTRLFKQVALLSPRAYITRARVNAACCMLRESDKTVTAIARALGYSSVYHFSKQFRRHTGTTASAWREKHAAPSSKA
jgi:AraC-like DNA-binding protein